MDAKFYEEEFRCHCEPRSGFAGRGRGSKATPAHPDRGGRSNLIFPSIYD